MRMLNARCGATLQCCERVRLARLKPYATSAFVCGAIALVASGLVLGTLARAQEAKPGTARTAWDGVYTEEQAGRGRVLYMDVCASCHAKDLRGDSTAPSLVEESFSFQWDDATIGELFVRIRTLMPSDRPNSLSPQRYRDIVAFILQANKFPPGGQELDADADALQRIRITTKRP
jgi:mono/diheme cytochrome c family protein